MSLHELLNGVTRVTGVTAAAVVDYEGIPIETHVALGPVHHEHLCAWAAEVGRLATDLAQVWAGGPLEVALFEASMGSLMLADVAKGYLVVAGDPTLNAGMLRLEVERTAEGLKRFLAAGLASGNAAEQHLRSAFQVIAYPDQNAAHSE